MTMNNRDTNNEPDFPGFRGREYVCPLHQEVMSLIPAVRTLFLVAVSTGVGKSEGWNGVLLLVNEYPL